MPRPAASGWEHDGDEQSAFRTTDANTEENTPLLSQKQNHSLGNMVSKDGVESRWLDFLWIVVACGYMAPMTSVASLISFFKAKYGAGYYVKLVHTCMHTANAQASAHDIAAYTHIYMQGNTARICMICILTHLPDGELIVVLRVLPPGPPHIPSPAIARRAARR
jgi:hypothetical protein